MKHQQQQQQGIQVHYRTLAHAHRQHKEDKPLEKYTEPQNYDATT